MPYLLISFKTVQDRIFAVFLPCERIKISGCSLEFKSNLNSNANQPILSTLGMRREGRGLLCAWRVYTRNLFSCVGSGAQMKGVAQGFVNHSNSNILWIWMANQFILIIIHSKWCTKKGRGKASAWEKIYENLFLMNSNRRRWGEVAQGDKSRWFQTLNQLNWTNLIKIG